MGENGADGKRREINAHFILLPISIFAYLKFFEEQILVICSFFFNLSVQVVDPVSIRLMIFFRRSLYAKLAFISDTLKFCFHFTFSLNYNHMITGQINNPI